MHVVQRIDRLTMAIHSLNRELFHNEKFMFQSENYSIGNDLLIIYTRSSTLHGMAGLIAQHYNTNYTLNYSFFFA